VTADEYLLNNSQKHFFAYMLYMGSVVFAKDRQHTKCQ